MTENFSFSSDFINGLNSSQFENEIKASSIKADLIAISTADDLVQIVFTTSLDSEDKSILNGLIASHIPNPFSINEYIKISINDSTHHNEYSLIYSFAINDNYKLNIAKLGITSKMTGSITSYDIRIFDFTHNKVLTTANLNNTSFQLLDLGVLQNVNIEESLLEIHVKKNGGNHLDKVFINELTIYAE